MSGLSVAQALALLGKLRQAAPPATGDKLAQVAALVENLAEENAYLNALVSENAGLLAAPPAPLEPLPPAPAAEPPPADGLVLLDLLAGVNDALRAPLVAIRERAEMVQTGLLGQITDEQEYWLTAIYSNTERAFRLLDTVQQIIAIEQGRVKIERTNFVSTDLLEEAHRRAAGLIAERRHRLGLAVPESVPLATGDFYQSLVVLADLLDNAARYTPEGGTIRLSVDSLGTHVLFSVADSGIGLSAEDLANVGRPFWRADRHPLVRLHTGTGLRLFLAKLVLAQQSGELIFSGEPGTGSTFSFTLPSPT